MIGRIAAAAILTAGFGGAAQAVQPTESERNCRDDRGVDRCSDEQQRRMRGLYGVRAIEEHRQAGDEVRRIFYVDGYGRDLVLIAFVRAAGRDPELEVHFPARDRETRREALRAAVPQGVWHEVLDGSANFHRSFAPEAPNPREVEICLHSWVYTIEAAERPRGARAAAVRRKVEDACEHGPGQVYAQELQRTALSLLPPCAALDARYHRSAASTLAACRMLHGDRLAAAEALNRAEAFKHIQAEGDAGRIAGLFAHQTMIDWMGQPYRGGGVAAAPFWVERARPARGSTNFYFERVEGENADRVRMTGLISRSADTPCGAGTGIETAPVELIWVRDLNRELRVERATVGRWRLFGS